MTPRGSALALKAAVAHLSDVFHSQSVYTTKRVSRFPAEQPEKEKKPGGSSCSSTAAVVLPVFFCNIYLIQLCFFSNTFTMIHKLHKLFGCKLWEEQLQRKAITFTEKRYEQTCTTQRHFVKRVLFNLSHAFISVSNAFQKSTSSMSWSKEQP